MEEKNDPELDIKNSIPIIENFEKSINDFVIGMTPIYLLSREDDIINAARKLLKRVEKMKKFRENFKSEEGKDNKNES